MDGAHVSLVSLVLNDTGFTDYRCDKPITLGVNLADLAKILKMSVSDDIVVLKAEEQQSFLTIIFDNKSTYYFSSYYRNW